MLEDWERECSNCIFMHYDSGYSEDFCSNPESNVGLTSGSQCCEYWLSEEDVDSIIKELNLFGPNVSYDTLKDAAIALAKTIKWVDGKRVESSEMRKIVENSIIKAEIQAKADKKKKIEEEIKNLEFKIKELKKDLEECQ